jgi:hypothetical protein
MGTRLEQEIRRGSTSDNPLRRAGHEQLLLMRSRLPGYEGTDMRLRPPWMA